MSRKRLGSLARLFRRPHRPITLPASAAPARGRALLSYLADPAAWRDDDPRLTGHSNKWESREIARQLSRLGLEVDVIDFDDDEFVPAGPYDVVLGIHSELHRLAGQAEARAALMHHTGAYPSFQNAAELRRIEELYERRGLRCVPRRQVPAGDQYDATLRDAVAASLLGNDWTLSTFPEEHRRKVTCIPVTGSQLSRPKRQDELVPGEREFLWFFGSGAVHKGLDRTLEAFARRPELGLHVVGNIGGEKDFVEAYRRELHELPNIHWHGFLEPDTAEFQAVARRCFCVVAPTCCEGTSPATITMLQLGLHPLISRECGITLPDGAGRYLETCAVEEVETAAVELHTMPEGALRDQIRATQATVSQRHSREGFRRRVGDYLRAAIEER
jgi:glycosyltransferase involved in cell wall biosynthesis